MQIEDILDDMPTTPQERADMVVFLLEMIEHWNAGISRHQSYPEPDLFTIEQFTDQRNTYIGQLALVMNQYGLAVQLSAAPSDQATRVAA